jgi:hypothetical protein
MQDAVHYVPHLINSFSCEKWKNLNDGQCVECDYQDKHVIIVPVTDSSAPAVPRFDIPGSTAVYVFHSTDASELQHLTLHKTKFTGTTNHHLSLQTLTLDECTYGTITVENVKKVIIKNCTIDSLIVAPGTSIEIIGTTIAPCI